MTTRTTTMDPPSPLELEEKETEDVGFAGTTSNATAEELNSNNEYVESLLKSLRKSKTLEEAQQAIENISELFSEEDSSRTDQGLKETIVELDGIRAILLAMNRLQDQSSDFVISALETLCCITQDCSEASISVIKIGGIESTLKTVEKHKNIEEDVVNGAVALLYNISSADGGCEDTKQQVSKVECIDCVIKSMKTWPDNSNIQYCGCAYLYNILDIPEVKPILEQKKIDDVLATVLENFRNNDEEVYESAKDALNKMRQDGTHESLAGKEQNNSAMDKKMPATNDNVVATKGESSGSASQEDEKKSVTEEEDVYEPYRREYRDLLKNPSNRTIDDKMRILQRAMNPPSEAEERDSMEKFARMRYEMRPIKKRKREPSNNKPPQTASSIAAELMADTSRFMKELADLQDPTIPPHNFKVGDDVKVRFANFNTQKISLRTYSCKVIKVNEDGTVDICVERGPFGVDSFIDRGVNPRTLQAFKRRKHKRTA